MAAPGGPLLRVGDMLKDLAEDSSFGSNAPPPPASPLTHLPKTEKPVSGFNMDKDGLPQSFEDTSNKLMVALKQSGHSWTGLTQELCATLATADKVVASAHTNLTQLTLKVRKLAEIIERGEDAFQHLQASAEHNKDVSLQHK